MPKADYDTLAKFYDEGVLLPEEEYDGVSPFVQFTKKSKEEHNANAQSLLDLACGTGSFLKDVDGMFASLSGIDVSEEMLDIARQKVPHAVFDQQDMRTFAVDDKYDIITSYFDAINHLLTFKDWGECVESVARHLNPHGLFLFDFNTLAQLKRLESSSFHARQLSGQNFLLLRVREVKPRLFAWEVKIFEKAGANQYTLHEQTVYETSFSLKEITSVLSPLFSNVEVYDAGLTPTREETGRLFISCQKE